MTARRAPIRILGHKVPAPFSRVRLLVLLAALALAPLHALAREPGFCSVPIEALRQELLASLPERSWPALPPVVRRWDEPSPLILEIFEADDARSPSRDVSLDRSLAVIKAVASLGLGPDFRFELRMRGESTQASAQIELIFMSESELRNARQITLRSDWSGEGQCYAVIRSQAGNRERITKSFVLVHGSASPLEIERCVRVGFVRVLGLLRWRPGDDDGAVMQRAHLFLRTLYNRSSSSSPAGLDELGDVLRKEYHLACR
jgi:hypothetical protein